ncbi:MAG: HNH endonuclease signature motif containing protein [Bacteroidota bacterium]
MSRYISDTYRLQVKERASFLCEYCLLHEEDSFFPFEVDHIISLKHGGASELDNLAYSCIYCNRNKGSDIGSVLLPDLEFIRLYHPRLDKWEEHMELDGAILQPKTKIGQVTVKILDLNHVNRLMERRILIEIGRYPIGV